MNTVMDFDKKRENIQADVQERELSPLKMSLGMPYLNQQNGKH
jgi:hypothetical protein